MLGHHLKQWAYIKPALARYFVYTGQDQRGRKSDEVPSGQVAKFCQEKRR